MNGWERWGKRFCKGALWAPAYFFGSLGLGLEPSWQLLTLVVACGFWSNLLDGMIPTDEASALSSTHQKTPS